MRREQPIGNWATLGPAVRDARNRAHLTQAALAERAGVSRGWLIRFEAGLPNAEPVTVFRLLRVLDLELTLSTRPRADEMFADEGAPPEWQPDEGLTGVDIEAILARLDEPEDQHQ